MTAATDKFIDIQSLVGTAKVPVLPSGVPELMSKLTDENITFQQLAETLECFPTISARLLGLANSPWSAPSLPVTSLDIACSRLGLDTVRSVSIALAISAPFNPQRCAVFDHRRYWCSALLVAEMASRLAFASSETVAVMPSTARAAGLLHNLGLLWLADCLPGETAKALAMTANEPGLSVNAALIACCGVGHNQAGSALAHAWRLPSPVLAAMSYHTPGQAGTMEGNVAYLVATAAALVSTLYREPEESTVNLLFGGLNIGVDSREQVYSELNAAFPRIQELAGNLFPNRSRFR